MNAGCCYLGGENPEATRKNKRYRQMMLQAFVLSIGHNTKRFTFDMTFFRGACVCVPLCCALYAHVFMSSSACMPPVLYKETDGGGGEVVKQN